MPIKAEAKEHCDPEMFAEFLERLYDSDEVLQGPSRRFIKEMTKISMRDLTLALKKMKNRKSADEFGISLEMVKYGPEELREKILDLLNQMILDG